jgi:hypothetical protein
LDEILLALITDVETECNDLMTSSRAMTKIMRARVKLLRFHYGGLRQRGRVFPQCIQTWATVIFVKSFDLSWMSFVTAIVFAAVNPTRMGRYA